MSSNAVRRYAINAVTNYKLPAPDFNYRDLFNANVFTNEEMKKRLSSAVYDSMMDTIERGAQLDPSIADAVAAAMRNWAIDKGATHFAHVFFPLTGRSAEKHDSFYEPDRKGHTIVEFGGDLLIQGEPDGSSFPSGGIRSTHGARGYTAWDVTSPAYIIENPNGCTLCIPTAFVSWSGEALDTKVPLLRSIDVLNRQAQKVLKFFGDDGDFVNASAGPEQEYFLVDSHFVNARLDLAIAGRTVLGRAPAKAQQFDDHYFGAITPRVQAYMMDCERELFKLGVPAKTRHNEVAPGQYEIAPVYENANVAADHQQIMMTILTRVAPKYGLTCLLAEKPFAKVNGSGKHLNWSLGSKKSGNLLEPGDSPQENMRFLLVCAAVIRAVDKHARLVRSSISFAGNDHRLGAAEAPPAILSIFLGEQLTNIFKEIEAGRKAVGEYAGTMNLGVHSLPELPVHLADRNRTSPFVFTGNKFEFRAVGSSQSISLPLTVLNTIFAESLDFVAQKLEAGKADLSTNAQAIIQEIMRDHGRIIFNGNGYSDDWQREAEKRGLPNIRNAVEAIPILSEPENIALFKRYGVLSERESESFVEVKLEKYAMTLAMEAKLMAEMAAKQVYPAAINYQTQLAGAVVTMKAAGIPSDTTILEQVATLTSQLSADLGKLDDVLAHDSAETLFDEAVHMRDAVRPAMAAVRHCCDTLEGLVADELWPLPTYQEMLFLR